MEHLSSPASITSPSSTTRTPASALEAPTYTTAGTIYNPSTSQAIQPPNRRGRSFRWAGGGVHPDLTLLPKSFLATLPIRATGSGSRTPHFQQYSPLQQNYDRAVSPNPLNDQDHLDANMPPQEALLSTGDVSGSISSLLMGSAEDKSADGYAGDESDSDDSDSGMDPLMAMNVKSLHNLASYPNPNQKKAQKALLRGAQPNIQRLGWASRGQQTPLPASIRPIGSPPKTETSSQATQGPDSIRFWPPPHRDRSNSNTDLSAMAIVGKATGSSVLEPGPGPSTLADGPGAPRPLTAGPPGQRQYRPSTFDSTFKALQVNPQEQRGKELGDIASGHVEHQNLQLGTGVTGYYQQHQPALPRGILNSPHSGSSEACRDSQLNTGFGSNEEATRYCGGQGIETLRGVEFLCYPYVQGCQLPNWRAQIQQSSSRFEQGTGRLSKEAIRDMNERNARCWYAGTEILGRPVKGEGLCTKDGKPLGAIGDGRPAKSKSQSQHAPIDIDEANRMSTAEHAKPLIELTYATMARCFKGRMLNSALVAGKGHVGENGSI